MRYQGAVEFFTDADRVVSTKVTLGPDGDPDCAWVLATLAGAFQTNAELLIVIAQGILRGEITGEEVLMDDDEEDDDDETVSRPH